MTTWTNHEMAGLLPVILRADDPRPAREQLNERYAHGGGYSPFSGFVMDAGNHAALRYPGDPPYKEVSRAELPLSGETLVLFQNDWLAIINQDGTYTVVRVD